MYCKICNGSGIAIDPDAYDWGMRAAYGLPQKLEKKPENFYTKCPFCSVKPVTDIKILDLCSERGTDVCWNAAQFWKKWRPWLMGDEKP